VVEWLTVWGVSTVTGFVFKEVLVPLAKSTLEDYVKDFFKGNIKDFTLALEQDTLKKVLGKALKEFLLLVQQELKNADLSEEEIRKYIKSLQQFIHRDRVKEILGSAFEYERTAIDTKGLQTIWYEMNLQPLPDEEFSWKRVGRKYLEAVKKLIRESNELRPIWDSQTLEAIKKSVQDSAGIIPVFDLVRYQEAIQERYANLNLDCVDATVYDYREKLKVWQVFIAQNVKECQEYLPQVYEIPKEHLLRLRDSNQLEAEVAEIERERYKRVYFEQPIRSVLDIINNQQNKYTVILGDPGSGKSTLLQYIALNWARSPLNEVTQQPIPLLIELRTYARNHDEGHCKNFLEFLHQGSGVIYHLNQHQLAEQLKAGNAIVMFDGLDEIFDPGKREDVITAIHRFTNDYPQVRVIVTSRVIGYKPSRLKDAEFRHFMLQDLEKAQIQDFIYRWHELTFTDEADKLRKKERLQRAINESKAIAELGGNPLLLTLMAILNRNQELPRDRPELYNQASRLLLYQWDVDKALPEDSRLDSKTIDYKDKQAMLRQVAYHMQAQDGGLKGNLISADDLENILCNYLKSRDFDQPRVRAKLMIDQLRYRNFILCSLGGDYYAFVHRTFLEYFCASVFVWQFEKERSIDIEQLKVEVFGKHWQDETWHEVLRLISGMLEAKFTGEIIEYLMVQSGDNEKFVNVFLAAECLLEVKNRKEILAVDRRLLKAIQGLIKYDLNYYYEDYGKEANLVREIRIEAVAAVTVAWKDDPDTLGWLKSRATSDEDGSVRGAAVSALAAHFQDDPDTLALLKSRATSDEHGSVRRAAVSALAVHFQDDPDTLALLKSGATSDEDGSVRRAAVWVLAAHFQDDPDTLALLKSRATSDEHGSVRRAAVSALAVHFQDDPDTLALLKSGATSDEDGSVRHAAVSALAEHFKDDPDTLGWLKSRATSDEDGWVRHAAVSALAEHFKDDPDTLALLKSGATSDDDKWVRHAAVSALAEHFKDDPDTLALVKSRATSDDDKWVRHAAVSALAEHFKDDPDTLALVKSRATSDEDGWVRHVAVSALAKLFQDDPDTLALLKSGATSDDDKWVRHAAVSALAEHFKDDPDTLALVKSRATSDLDGDVRGEAVSALARGWRDEPWMFEFMRDIAVNDPFVRQEDREDNPRQVALQVIIKQYRHHPETLPLLRDRAENDGDEKVRKLATDG
jgi:predicted NACHT family NTPase